MRFWDAKYRNDIIISESNSTHIAAVSKQCKVKLSQIFLTDCAGIQLPPTVRYRFQTQHPHPGKERGRQDEEDQDSLLDVPLDPVRDEGGREGDDAAGADGDHGDSTALLVIDPETVVEVDGHDGGPGAHDPAGDGVDQARTPDIPVAEESLQATPEEVEKGKKVCQLKLKYEVNLRRIIQR
jgi:hypothetical protein